MSLKEEMMELARQSKQASRLLPRMSTDDKNACLNAMAIYFPGRIDIV